MKSQNGVSYYRYLFAFLNRPKKKDPDEENFYNTELERKESPGHSEKHSNNWFILSDYLFLVNVPIRNLLHLF